MSFLKDKYNKAARLTRTISDKISMELGGSVKIDDPESLVRVLSAMEKDLTYEQMNKIGETVVMIPRFAEEESIHIEQTTSLLELRTYLLTLKGKATALLCDVKSVVNKIRTLVQEDAYMSGIIEQEAVNVTTILEFLGIGQKFNISINRLSLIDPDIEAKNYILTLKRKLGDWVFDNLPDDSAVNLRSLFERNPKMSETICMKIFEQYFSNTNKEPKFNHDYRYCEVFYFKNPAAVRIEATMFKELILMKSGHSSLVTDSGLTYKECKSPELRETAGRHVFTDKNHKKKSVRYEYFTKTHSYIEQ